jgi:hypothetical protein
MDIADNLHLIVIGLVCKSAKSGLAFLHSIKVIHKKTPGTKNHLAGTIDFAGRYDGYFDNIPLENPLTVPVFKPGILAHGFGVYKKPDTGVVFVYAISVFPKTTATVYPGTGGFLRVYIMF